MKYSIYALLIFIQIGCQAQNQKFSVIYIQSDGEKILLSDEHVYDNEEKPYVFYIVDKFSENDIYIIELYRLIGEDEHFYKSFTFRAKEIGEGFNVEGVFSDVTSPFIVPYGFIIQICKTERSAYRELKSYNDCQSWRRIIIKLED